MSDHVFINNMGQDCTARVMGMVKESGMPLEFWEQLPEWKQPFFANVFLGIYIRMKYWNKNEDNK